MSSDVALRSGEDDMTNADDDMTNADDELADSDYDSRRDPSCASASADSIDRGSSSDDEGGSPCDGDSGNDSGPDHVPDQYSSHSTHHGHHHGYESHHASGDGQAMSHSSDHGSDSGSGYGAQDPDWDEWFWGARGEGSCGPPDTASQAEYALGSDFASGSVSLEACQGRDEKVRNLKASLCKLTKEKAVSKEHASCF